MSQSPLAYERPREPGRAGFRLRPNALIAWCGQGAYCALDACGGTGVCKEWKVNCDSPEVPVACQCSGVVTYHCEDDRWSLDPNFGCTLPEGDFACGAVACDQQSRYCQRAAGKNDAFGVCMALPAACADFATATCDCFPPELLKNDVGACTCDKTADHFEIRCPEKA